MSPTRALKWAAVLTSFSLAAGCHDATAPNESRRVGEWDTLGRVRNRWYKSQSGYGAACPTVAGSFVVFGTGNGLIVARDRATGNEQWQARVNPSGYSVDAALLTVKDVVVALADYQTVGVDRATGRVLWYYAAPPDSNAWFGYPAAPGFLARNDAAADSAGTVYVPAWGGSVSAVDVYTGLARWVWRLDSGYTFNSGASATAVAGDTILAALWQNTNLSGTEVRGILVTLDRATGRELARAALPFSPTRIGGRIVTTPDAVIVASGGAGELAAVDRRTGAVRWQFSPPPDQYGFQHSSSSGVSGDADVVFTDGGNDHFYALRAATGEQLWENDQYGSTTATATASPRRVYSSDGWALSVFGRENGEVVAKVLQPGHDKENFDGLIGCVTVAGGEVYVTTDGAAWSFWEP
jgi:outer membrane protein assembly factor BamB